MICRQASALSLFRRGKRTPTEKPHPVEVKNTQETSSSDAAGTMKVVQINSGDLMGRRFNGFDLTRHLEQHDVESKLLVYWNKNSDAPFVSRAFAYPGNRYITRALNILERQLSLHARLHPHSWALTMHKAVREADLMHLHIIHDGYFSLSALPYVTSRKPTVWTWHDPWPMTGHCIYPLQCRRWQVGCGSCPDLTLPFPMKTDRTAEQFSWKERVYSRTRAEIVVASRWMLEMAKQSPLAQAFQLLAHPIRSRPERLQTGQQAGRARAPRRLARSSRGIHPRFRHAFQGAA